MGAISYHANLKEFIGNVKNSILLFFGFFLLVYLLYFPSLHFTGLTWFIFYLVEVVACTALINVAVTVKISSESLVNNFLKNAGARSYSLYVLHFQFLSWGGLLGQPNGINFSHPKVYDFILIFSFLIFFPVLEFVHKCIELPAIRLSSRWAKEI